MMHHIDLCSGIGGFSLGFQQAGLSKPVLFCDTDAWCRKVLAKHWPGVLIAEDVKELANEPDRLIPRTDPRNTILTAGYPCQPFSVAGKQRGTEDDRHIWPYISQIISRKRPAWCVFENVHGHIALGLDQVLADLEAQGYATRTFIVPACGVNAPHRRDRVWIIARNVGNAAHNGRDGRAAQAGREGQAHQPQQQPSVRGEPIRPSEAVADTEGNRRIERQSNSQGRSQGNAPREKQRFGDDDSLVAYTDNEGSQGRLPRGSDTERQGVDGHFGRSSTAHRQPAKDWWAVEPPVGRVAHGIPRRVDRLKGLGNAIVPQIAQRIGETIKKAEGL